MKNVKSIVVSLYCKQVGIERKTLKAKDLNKTYIEMNSLDFFEFIFNIEKELQISIDDDLIEGFFKLSLNDFSNKVFDIYRVVYEPQLN